VPDEAHVDHGGGQLGSDHVLEPLLAQIHGVNRDFPRVALPGDPIDAAHLVVFEEPAGQEPALASRNSRNQNFFHCNSGGLQ
jgi:hypothetical protein